MPCTRSRKRRAPGDGHDGADASRRAIGAADYHPLSVRRFAPAIKRLQRTVIRASKLARPPAADPQPRYARRHRKTLDERMRHCMESFWIQTPPDGILMQRAGWADLGNKQFAAIRHHLLVRMGTDSEPRNGPIHKQVEWPIDAEFKSEDKITIVAKYTVTLQEAITSAFSATLSHEVLTKLGSAFDAGVDKLSASIKSEVETRLGTVLTSSLQKTVSSTRTFSYETTTEKSESVAFKVPASAKGPATRKVYSYVKMRRLFWDVYLYRVDVLRLEYRKPLLWKDIRKTMASCEVELKVPLFRLYYFQPEPALSYTFDSYTPDDDEFEGVTMSSIATIPKWNGVRLRYLGIDSPLFCG